MLAAALLGAVPAGAATPLPTEPVATPAVAHPPAMLHGDHAETLIASSLGRLALVRFDTSPFPFHGDIPERGTAFLDVTSGDRHGHTSPRGGILWEDQTYSDRRVLVFIPKTFNVNRPASIVLFFHGNLATLQRDVVERQHVPLQLAQSGLNAVLVAPQFASNALDSSAGHFWDPGALERFLDEASGQLARLDGDPGTRRIFAHMPVVLVAYSGGYLPAAFSLQWGGAEARLRGVVLLDALFGETPKFLDWILRRHAATFFFSGYSASSEKANEDLKHSLAEHGLGFANGLPGRLDGGTIGFVSAGHADHNGFVTQAWMPEPLRAVLSKIAPPGPGPTAAEPVAPVAEPVALPPARPAAMAEPAPKPAGQPYGTLRPGPGLAPAGSDAPAAQ